MPKNLVIDESIVCALGMQEVYGSMIEILKRKGERVLSSGSLAPLKESCDIYFDHKNLEAQIAKSRQQKPEFIRKSPGT